MSSWRVRRRRARRDRAAGARASPHACGRGRSSPLPAHESECRYCAVSGGCRKPRFAMAPVEDATTIATPPGARETRPDAARWYTGLSCSSTPETSTRCRTTWCSLRAQGPARRTRSSESSSICSSVTARPWSRACGAARPVARRRDDLQSQGGRRDPQLASRTSSSGSRTRRRRPHTSTASGTSRSRTSLGAPTLSDDDIRTRARRALARLPSARFGTLHSFATGIVRAHAIELGLGPGFELATRGGRARPRRRRDRTGARGALRDIARCRPRRSPRLQAASIGSSFSFVASSSSSRRTAAPRATSRCRQRDAELLEASLRTLVDHARSLQAVAASSRPPHAISSAAWERGDDAAIEAASVALCASPATGKKTPELEAFAVFRKTLGRHDQRREGAPARACLSHAASLRRARAHRSRRPRCGRGRDRTSRPRARGDRLRRDAPRGTRAPPRSAGRRRRGRRRDRRAARRRVPGYVARAARSAPAALGTPRHARGRSRPAALRDAQTVAFWSSAIASSRSMAFAAPTSASSRRSPLVLRARQHARRSGFPPASRGSLASRSPTSARSVTTVEAFPRSSRSRMRSARAGFVPATRRPSSSRSSTSPRPRTCSSRPSARRSLPAIGPRAPRGFASARRALLRRASRRRSSSPSASRASPGPTRSSSVPSGGRRGGATWPCWRARTACSTPSPSRWRRPRSRMSSRERASSGRGRCEISRRCSRSFSIPPIGWPCWRCCVGRGSASTTRRSSV